jgi:hypothetical protein
MFCLFSWASMTAPQSRAEFCAMRQNPTYFIELAKEPYNRLSFQNQGGLFNGGVCWWHSLFQRASIYLAVFRPELAKPSLDQAKAIVYSLAAGKKVVEIPGYSNMYNFSHSWQKVIQSQLEEWQLVDGFLKFKCIEGLSGSTSDDPTKILGFMSQFMTAVEQNHQILWTMLQLSGISSHAALLIDVAQSPKVYTLSHIDSNFPSLTNEFYYFEGDRSIKSADYGSFVTYPGRNSDLKNFKMAADHYCSLNFFLNSAPVDEKLYNGIE